MSNPLVSICIPTYNRQNYVFEALESALKQTYPHLEIIISDNASVDNTVKQIIKVKDKRIKLYVQKNNLGMVPNWNECIKKASGKYIKFVASDDLIEPQCVERLIQPLEKKQTISLVACKRKLINHHGKTLTTLHYTNRSCKVNGLRHARWLLTNIHQNKIGEPSAVMFRRDDAFKAGLFDPRFSQFADFEFWIRLLSLGDLYYLNQKLCSFRLHPDSGTTKSQISGGYINEVFWLIDKYYHNPNFQEKYQLQFRDETLIRNKKILDIIKGIKDLFISGNIVQARRHYSLLNQHVSLEKITRTTIAHLLKQ